MKCFYVPGAETPIDTIREGTELSTCYGKSLSQIQKEFPGAEIWEWKDAYAASRQAIYRNRITKPAPITSDRFHEMLEVLPPMSWRKGDNSESFMLAEGLIGDLRYIFCRVGSRCFEFIDRDSLSHQEILDKCQSHAASIQENK